MCTHTYTHTQNCLLLWPVWGVSCQSEERSSPYFFSLSVIEKRISNPFVIWSLTCIDDESVVVDEGLQFHSFCVNFSRDLFELF